MAKFSKQHYQVIADLLRAARNWELYSAVQRRQQDSIDCLAAVFADKLGEDNLRFDREHFLAVVRGERSVNSRPPR